MLLLGSVAVAARALARALLFRSVLEAPEEETDRRLAKDAVTARAPPRAAAARGAGAGAGGRQERRWVAALWIQAPGLSSQAFVGMASPAASAMLQRVRSTSAADGWELPPACADCMGWLTRWPGAAAALRASAAAGACSTRPRLLAAARWMSAPGLQLGLAAA